MAATVVIAMKPDTTARVRVIVMMFVLLFTGWLAERAGGGGGGACRASTEGSAARRRDAVGSSGAPATIRHSKLTRRRPWQKTKSVYQFGFITEFREDSVARH